MTLPLVVWRVPTPHAWAWAPQSRPQAPPTPARQALRARVAMSWACPQASATRRHLFQPGPLAQWCAPVVWTQPARLPLQTAPRSAVGGEAVPRLLRRSPGVPAQRRTVRRLSHAPVPRAYWVGQAVSARRLWLTRAGSWLAWRFWKRGDGARAYLWAAWTPLLALEFRLRRSARVVLVTLPWACVAARVPCSLRAMVLTRPRGPAARRLALPLISRYRAYPW